MLVMCTIIALSNAAWWKPTPGTAWQIQPTGQLDTSDPAQVIIVDLFLTDAETISHLHNEHRMVFCQFSAGTWEADKPDAANYGLSILGHPVDGRTSNQRWINIRALLAGSGLDEVLTSRMDLAESKGCDGIVPDHVDLHMKNTGFQIERGTLLGGIINL